MSGRIFFESDRESRIDLTALADNPCPVRSSVTDRGCLLPAGHPAYRPDRFHRYRLGSATPDQGKGEPR